MFVGKQFDIVMGLDIHIIQPPGPVPPIPIPHPFIGIVFDPMEFIPIIGASILVNGVPRAQAGTAVKGVPPHFPIGGVFVKPPSNEGEIFMGSLTVPAEGEPLAFMVSPVLTCQDFGMLSIPRPNRKSKTKVKSFVLPTSILLCIPANTINIPDFKPTISMMGIALKVVGKLLGKAKRMRTSMRAVDEVAEKAAKEAAEKAAKEAAEKAAEKAAAKLNLDKVLKDPSILENKSLEDVKKMLGNPNNWRHETMRQGRSKGKGWILREYSKAGTETGRLIQYHPGSVRKFNNLPYWKVATGAQPTVRFKASI